MALSDYIKKAFKEAQGVSIEEYSRINCSCNSHSEKVLYDVPILSVSAREADRNNLEILSRW
ncbi:MAG: hypothetical protein Q8L27_02035 [archaeon]|nr:hypothetical protein [archaeon]